MFNRKWLWMGTLEVGLGKYMDLESGFGYGFLSYFDLSSRPIDAINKNCKPSYAHCGSNQQKVSRAGKSNMKSLN